jgi:cysteinyl-tRNA synthetase
MLLYNTLSGQKEEFIPQGDTITMYVCGVTVYDDCHIGHAMSYILFDVIRRYFKFKGLSVKYVQNFTDIDDKIINRSQQLGMSSSELSEKYIAEYFKDMDRLNITRADVYPKATEEIPKIIELIEGLVKKGYAYASNRSVYYRVKRFPEYGKLSHQNTDDMLSNSAPDTDEKESPLDFALWKATKQGEPSWESPWGSGRPGWHIECSAMSLKYLGDTIDIHGGGKDLIFPHHENEIAQSESFTGKPFVNYWLHNGLLQLSGDKMSKSLGNLVTIKDALSRFSPDAIRFFILSSHYRSPITYSEETLTAAEAGIERIRQAVKKQGNEGKNAGTLDSAPFKNKFIESMDDDFNSAQAIAALFDLAREINRCAAAGMNIDEARQTLLELSNIMGFTLEEPEGLSTDAGPLIDLLISVRNELRKEKNWRMSDKIRDELAALGITLEDSPNGTTWKQSR